MGKRRRILALLFACFTWLLSIQVFAEDTQENETAERFQKAEELGLMEWIDEEGYLIDSFFAGKSDSEVSNMSLDGLVRVLTEEEVDAYVARLNAGISLYAVTSYQKIAQKNPDTGRYLYTGMFEVDGILAFCIERDASTPAQGSTTSDWIAVTNEGIRKVLYYGYNGPADCGYTFVETAMAVAEANGRGDNSMGRNIYAEISVMESPPEDFYAWKVETNDGSTQELAFYTYDKAEGSVSLKKTSANPDLTNYNSNFSLAGAVYGIYQEESCETEVGRLVTGDAGVSEELELEPGTYYVKEIEAPRGFELSTEVHSVIVNKDENTVVTVADRPIVKVELTKLMEGSTEVLAGAVFRYTAPDGTQMDLTTGEDGKITLENLQEGIHQIEEIQAPAGYIRNQNSIIFAVEANNRITVTSQVNDIYGQINTKKDTSGNLLIEVENKIGYKLPNTGSFAECSLYLIGSFLAVWSLQKKENNL